MLEHYKVWIDVIAAVWLIWIACSITPYNNFARLLFVAGPIFLGFLLLLSNVKVLFG